MSLSAIFDPMVREYFKSKYGGGGGEADHSMEDGLIDGTITEYRNDMVESVAEYAFYKNQNLERILLPNVKTVGEFAFAYALKLKLVDLGMATSIGGNMFYMTHANHGGSSPVVVLRSETPLDNVDDIGSDVQHIYAPRSAVEYYEENDRDFITGAILYSYTFHALEDYTVDGTITGELDLTKMGL